MDGRCKETVWRQNDFRGHQCSRKPVRDGYCKAHHPDTKAAKRAAWEAEWNAKEALRDANRKEAAALRARLSEIATAEVREILDRLAALGERP